MMARAKVALTAIVILGLCGGLAAALVYYRQINRRAASAVRTPVTVHPQVRRLNTVVTATGTIRVRTGAEVRVGTQISGIVTKLNVTTGSPIEKGAVIAEIEARGLDARISQAQSQIEVDRAAVRKLEREWVRTSHLLEAGLIPRQQAEDLEEDLKSAQAQLEKSYGDLIVVQSDLPYLIIRAPISGTVSSVSTQQGETVAASFNAPTFVTIMEDNALELIAMVDETDIANVRPSNHVDFTTETYQGREFQGIVNRVAPKATVVSGVVNYEVSVIIRSGLSVLKPDMTANVTIETARRSALLVPSAAIHAEGDKRFVLVARNGASERREVSVGQREGGWDEIRKGLAPEDDVLMSNVFNARTGDQDDRSAATLKDSPAR